MSDRVNYKVLSCRRQSLFIKAQILPKVLFSLRISLTGCSFLAFGLLIVAVSFLKSLGRLSGRMLSMTSQVRPTGCTSLTDVTSLAPFPFPFPFRSSNPGPSLGIYLTGNSSRITDSWPWDFVDSEATTIILNGLPVTWHFRFLTMMRCSPGYLGTKTTLRVLSGFTASSTGSSLNESGLLSVAVSFWTSPGRLSPGMKSGYSQRLLIVILGAGSSTMTENGLPGTSSPDFFTWIKYLPDSDGTTESPELGNDVG